MNLQTSHWLQSKLYIGKMTCKLQIYENEEDLTNFMQIILADSGAGVVGPWLWYKSVMDSTIDYQSTLKKS